MKRPNLSARRAGYWLTNIPTRAICGLIDGSANFLVGTAEGIGEEVRRRKSKPGSKAISEPPVSPNLRLIDTDRHSLSGQSPDPQTVA